jgi:RNA-splicing ligase RtcB
MIIIDRVVPNLVGVDLGCGMATYELGQIDVDFAGLDQFIRENIPNGFGVYNRESHLCDELLDGLFCKEHINKERAQQSIGTLGAGNHFIEIDVDNQNNKYLIIHSGSRHVGLQVANYYQKVAVEQDQHGNKDLAYLTDQNMSNYIHDMQLMQQYAVINRKTMGSQLIKYLGVKPLDEFQTIHNYIDVRIIWSDSMMGMGVLRKGAISAYKNEKLLIPLNMADGSLICIGKYNPDWNWSAPHGAGRVLSRRKAKEQIDIEAFRQRMDEAGVWTSCVSEGTLDESPMAYKDASAIIDAIDDTAEIVAHLKPVYNFKAN